MTRRAIVLRQLFFLSSVARSDSRLNKPNSIMLISDYENMFYNKLLRYYLAALTLNFFSLSSKLKLLAKGISAICYFGYWLSST